MSISHLGSFRLLPLVVVLLISGVHAQGALVPNGGFENPVLSGNQEVGLAAGTTSLPSWTVAGSVSLYSSAYTLQYTGGADSTQLIDLTGQTAGGGSIAQTLTTVAGRSYRVTVDNYNYGVQNASAITGGKAFSIQATGSAATGYFTAYRTETTVSYDFVATGANTTLTLKDLSGFDSNAGWIDNVTLAVVPEFTHWAVFAAFGLIAFATELRCRRRGPQTGCGAVS